jgi:hypothetical protein
MSILGVVMDCPESGFRNGWEKQAPPASHYGIDEQKKGMDSYLGFILSRFLKSLREENIKPFEISGYIK